MSIFPQTPYAYLAASGVFGWLAIYFFLLWILIAALQARFGGTRIPLILHLLPFAPVVMGILAIPIQGREGFSLIEEDPGTNALDLYPVFCRIFMPLQIGGLLSLVLVIWLVSWMAMQDSDNDAPAADALCNPDESVEHAGAKPCVSMTTDEESGVAIPPERFGGSAD